MKEKIIKSFLKHKEDNLQQTIVNILKEFPDYDFDEIESILMDENLI